MWARGELSKALDKCLQGMEFYRSGGDGTKANILGRFESRIRGDIVYTKYSDKISGGEWDTALTVLVETLKYYDETQDSKLLSMWEGVKPRLRVVEAALKVSMGSAGSGE